MSNAPAKVQAVSLPKEIKNSVAHKQNSHLIASPACSTPPNTPWGTFNNSNVTKANLASLEEVMSEQLATQLQLHEESLNNPEPVVNPVGINEGTSQFNVSDHNIIDDEPAANDGIGDHSTDSDAILAQMLQEQMDREYNEYISKQENQVNKNSKVKLVYNNFRTDDMFVSSTGNNESISSDDEDEIDEEEESSYYASNSLSNEDPTSNMINFNNSKGYVVFGNELITKHDKEICGRRNTAKLEDCTPLEFRTGDARGMDLQLSNKIYNSLRKHASTEERRSQRLHENKEHSTAEHAVDEKTRLILHRMIDKGVLDSVSGVISIGKEAVVLHVEGGDIANLDAEFVSNSSKPDNFSHPIRSIPRECAVKIYKTHMTEFRQRDRYIKDDYRFKDRYKKLNARKVVHLWAEKEMHNLLRIHEVGIPCPEVVLLKKHVLVMSFIGSNQVPAPKLKTATLSSKDLKEAYKQVLEIMLGLYNNCNLIHADLSEYNLLWFDKKVWVIDVSQAVEPSHPCGLDFLYRDCKNISRFFKSNGVPDVMEPMQLFNHVSSLDLPTSSEADFTNALETLQLNAEEQSKQRKTQSSKMLEDAVVVNHDQNDETS